MKNLRTFLVFGVSICFSWILMGVLYSMKDFSKFDLVKARAWITLYLEECKLDKKKEIN